MSGQLQARVGVLGSGRGSNLAAIADRSSVPGAPYKVVLVLSDVERAGILERARDRGIPRAFIPPGNFRTKLDEAAEAAYIAALRAAAVDWVALAGFMRVLKGEFLRAFPQRVINIHPALLPAFPGLEAWRQALDHGVKFTGCSVHLVDPGVDTGPILAQKIVPVLEEDTPETLHQRIQQAEHELYPATLVELATRELQVQGRRTRFGHRLPTGGSG